MKLNKIEKGCYEGEFNEKQFRVLSDYMGKDGYCETVQSWSLIFDDKTVDGFGTKKEAIAALK